MLGVRGRVLPFSEGSAGEEMAHLEIEDLNCFDGVLTHNSTGEYGHVHHRQVHNYVKDNFDGPVWAFGFGKGEFEYRLSEEEVMRKMTALQCYDHRLPYNGKNVMKWEALLHRYMQDMSFTRESFDAL